MDRESYTFSDVDMYSSRSDGFFHEYIFPIATPPGVNLDMIHMIIHAIAWNHIKTLALYI